jgi:hypothetical protein
VFFIANSGREGLPKPFSRFGASKEQRWQTGVKRRQILGLLENNEPSAVADIGDAHI